MSVAGVFISESTRFFSSLIFILLLSGCQNDDDDLGISNPSSNPFNSPETDPAIIDGLTVWRKPGNIQENAACANCLAPDGLDLAFLDIDDETFIRRAGSHLPPEDGVKIIKMIEGIRNKYGIKELVDIDMHQMEIDVPLPRWSNDHFDHFHEEKNAPVDHGMSFSFLRFGILINFWKKFLLIIQSMNKGKLL